MVRQPPQWARASSFMRFLDHTHNDATQSVGLLRTSNRLVAENSTWQHMTDIHAPGGTEAHNISTDLYLTTHNTHNRQTSMLPVGFKPTISAETSTWQHTTDRHPCPLWDSSPRSQQRPLPDNTQHSQQTERQTDIHAPCGIQAHNLSRDLYLTTHNTHNRQTSMPLVGFEPTISADEWPQTHALDRAATGNSKLHSYVR